MQAKKLPSGSWRVRVYSHTEEITLPDGTKKEKKVYKSFTCDDVTVKGKRKCEAEAAAWAVQKENHKESDLTTTLTPSMLSDRFAKLIKKENLPHFRFHDLRHYSASMQHALGVPDQYIMERGGWGSDGILKSVYRHALDDIKKTENEKINNRFSKLYDTKYDTKTKNP